MLLELQRSVLQHVLAIIVRIIPKFTDAVRHCAGTEQDFRFTSDNVVPPGNRKNRSGQANTGKKNKFCRQAKTCELNEPAFNLPI
jgi:hypothetical protein